jgi:hypothetical protein
MDIYPIKGKIYKVLPRQDKSEKFHKQEVIIQVTNPTDKGMFIEYIRLQCINDRIKLLEGANKGDFVIGKYTISGRKMGTGEDEVFYTNLDVLELKIINSSKDIIDQDKGAKTSSYAEKFPGIDEDEDDILSDTTSIPLKQEEDDLPF